MQHTSQEEDQEVKSGHSQRGSGHGVDSTQEEEGEDVLYVVIVSSVGREKHMQTLTHLFLILCHAVIQR